MSMWHVHAESGTEQVGRNPSSLLPPPAPQAHFYPRTGVSNPSTQQQRNFSFPLSGAGEVPAEKWVTPSSGSTSVPVSFVPASFTRG